jgi:hypothetical protein
MCPVLEPKLTASGAPLFSIVGSTHSVALVAYEHLNPVKVKAKVRSAVEFKVEPPFEIARGAEGEGKYSLRKVALSGGG